MYQVNAAIDLIELASEVEQSIRIGPESLRERLVRDAWTVYRQACNLIACARSKTAGWLGPAEPCGPLGSRAIERRSSPDLQH